MDYDALIERASLLAAWRKPGGPRPDHPSPKLHKTLVELIAAIADLRARNDALVKAAEALVYTGSEHDSWCSVGAIYNCTCDTKPAKDAMRAALAANREG